MFSGIVEEIGTIEARDDRTGGVTLTIQAKTVLGGAAIGDSIAVNGACLTVVRYDDTTFDVEMAPETLRKTSLDQCGSGDGVNLERSLLANGRVGGHFVQGHVDCTAEITAMEPDGEGTIITFRPHRLHALHRAEGLRGNRWNESYRGRHRTRLVYHLSHRPHPYRNRCPAIHASALSQPGSGYIRQVRGKTSREPTRSTRVDRAAKFISFTRQELRKSGS